MGAGIAQVAAQTGHKVTLVDISQQVRSKEIESFVLKNASPRFLTRATLASLRASSVWQKNSLLTMLTLLGNSSTGRSFR